MSRCTIVRISQSRRLLGGWCQVALRWRAMFISRRQHGRHGYTPIRTRSTTSHLQLLLKCVCMKVHLAFICTLLRNVNVEIWPPLRFLILKAICLFMDLSEQPRCLGLEHTVYLSVKQRCGQLRSGSSTLYHGRRSYAHPAECNYIATLDVSSGPTVLRSAAKRRVRRSYLPRE